jgi:hypothetical protein
MVYFVWSFMTGSTGNKIERLIMWEGQRQGASHTQQRVFQYFRAAGMGKPHTWGGWEFAVCQSQCERTRSFCSCSLHVVLALLHSGYVLTLLSNQESSPPIVPSAHSSVWLEFNTTFFCHDALILDYLIFMATMYVFHLG